MRAAAGPRRGALPGQVRGRHARVGAGGVAQAAQRAARRRRPHHVRGVQAARGPAARARRRRARARRHRGLRHVRPRVPRQVPHAARRGLDQWYAPTNYTVIVTCHNYTSKIIIKCLK